MADSQLSGDCSAFSTSAHLLGEGVERRSEFVHDVPALLLHSELATEGVGV
jgi:hypothetical protein